MLPLGSLAILVQHVPQQPAQTDIRCRKLQSLSCKRVKLSTWKGERAVIPSQHRLHNLTQPGHSLVYNGSHWERHGWHVSCRGLHVVSDALLSCHACLMLPRSMMTVLKLHLAPARLIMLQSPGRPSLQGQASTHFQQVDGQMLTDPQSETDDYSIPKCSVCS